MTDAAAPPRPAPEASPSGVLEARRIGRYRLCFELAAGGMGKVFLGRTEGVGGIHKLVALKTIHPHLASDAAFVDMFLDEARIASRITHPNVCSVFDVGVDGDTHFLAMELLVGEPLSRVFRRLARMPQEREQSFFPAYAAAIVAAACAGLHAAHELRGERGQFLGVVHRDVSPQNLFLNYDGSVRVVDFGIAKAAGRASTTANGTLKGKFSYLAPEAVESRTWDRRADIWAAGVVLWELLVGRKLFTGDGEAQVLMAVLGQSVPPPSQLGAPSPPGLDAIVLRALARDPAQRYGTAQEMSRDLLRFAIAQGNGEPIGAPEIGTWMERLFPSERARWREVIDQAAAMTDDGLPRVSRRLRSDSDTPSDLSVDVAVEASGVAQRPVEAETRLLGAQGGEGLAPPGRSVRLGMAAAMVLGVALVGAVAGWSLWPASPPTVAPVVAADGLAPTAPELVAEARPAPAPTPPSSIDAHAGEAVAEPVLPAGDELAPATERPRETRARSSRVRRGSVAAEAGVGRTPPRSEATAAGAPASTAAPGTLTVTTPGGWADLYLGGRSVGRAPGRLLLPAGAQRLEVRAFGRTPGIFVDVVVESGASSRISVPVSE